VNYDACLTSNAMAEEGFHDYTLATNLERCNDHAAAVAGVAEVLG
jgi:hypothetical protein